MDIVNLINRNVLPQLEAHIKKNMLQLDPKFIEERAFFYKIVGDYYRYASEATQSSSKFREKFKDGALEAYQKCTNIVKKGLKPYNSVRLGLALNYSVFQYEIMSDPTQACKIAKEALVQA